MKFYFLLNIDNDNIDDKNKKSEHSHVYGKRIDNSVFINTNWGFTSKLFVQEQTQMVRVDKNKTKLKLGRNRTDN